MASDLQNPQSVVTGILGTWTVPAVNASLLEAFSSAWIGIGGQFDPTLIQCGTSHDTSGGFVLYAAWIEGLPGTSITIQQMTISPGDSVSASIQLVDPSIDSWTVNITDITDGQSFQHTFTYGSNRLSAEWIVERPVVNGVLGSLSDFGSITFANCGATVGSSTGSIGAFSAYHVTMYSTSVIGPTSVQLASASALSEDGAGFTVTYLASR